MQRASLYLVDRIDVLTVITRQQWISEQTFLIDVTNYSVLRTILCENGYFDLC